MSPAQPIYHRRAGRRRPNRWLAVGLAAAALAAYIGIYAYYWVVS